MWQFAYEEFYEWFVLLCLSQIQHTDDMENEMDELLQEFEEKSHRPFLHTVCFYWPRRLFTCRNSDVTRHAHPARQDRNPVAGSRAFLSLSRSVYRQHKPQKGRSSPRRYTNSDSKSWDFGFDERMWTLNAGPCCKWSWRNFEREQNGSRVKVALSRKPGLSV